MTSPDLIGRDFTAAAPGQRLVGDITYLRTGEGWLYLATVIDLATRMVTGWQLAEHMRTSLVTDALAMAITHGHVQPGAIFHSDRARNTPRPSSPGSARPTASAPASGRTGVCWDNAAAESFFGALKNEMYYRQAFPGRARARFAVADYIEVFYNRQRLHSALGYRTPAGSTHRVPGRSNRCMINNPRNCPRSLTQLTPKCTVEPAHRALVGVRTQHLLGEPGPPHAPPGHHHSRAAREFQHRQIQADRVADHPAQARREVQVQQSPCGGGQGRRIPQQLLHLRPQAAHRSGPVSQDPLSGSLGPISAPEASRRSQISRSR